MNGREHNFCYGNRTVLDLRKERLAHFLPTTKAMRKLIMRFALIRVVLATTVACKKEESESISGTVTSKSTLHENG